MDVTSTSRGIKPSSRALANLDSGAFIDLENEASKLPRYDPETRPDGLIDLSGAVNGLMDDVLGEEMDKFAESYDLRKATRYGGVMGPRDLSEAVSSFVNRHFHPAQAVTPDNILVTNGVTSLIDLMAFGMCDPGEGIMVITPTYMMFPHDVCARAGVRLIPVHPDPPVENQFEPRGAADLVQALARAHAAALRYGITPKALLLCNPSNPCGRTYPRATLVEMARFCGARDMHLLSDEIYAMSTFDPDRRHPFTSVLSIPADPADPTPAAAAGAAARGRGVVLAENVHCLYGASKDFGSGGLRLGFLVTRNALLWRAVRRLALFTWVSTFSAAFFSRFLRSETAVDRYLATYRERLGRQYELTAGLLRENGIPFGPADSGVFVFVRLTKWLVYFEEGRSGDGSREMRLCRHLLNEAGVFLSPGELSLSPVPGCFRLIYTGTPDTVPIAISRLVKALSHLEQNSKLRDPERGSEDSEESCCPVHAVSYSSSPGTYILTGSADRSVRLYNPASQETIPRYTSTITGKPAAAQIPEGRLIQTYAAHGYEVLDLCVSSDNERFASCGGDRSVFLWDVASAATTRRFGGSAHGHSARVNCVSFAGDGDSLLVSGGFDTSVRVWDCKSNSAKPVQVLDEAKDAVATLAVRDAEIVAGSVDGRVRSYDVRMGRCVTDTMGASVTSLRLTRDGKAMLVGTLDSKVRLMDREKGVCLKTYAAPGWRNEELRVQSVLGGKEKYVVAGDELTAGTGPAGLNGQGKIWAWDLLTGRLVATVSVPWGPEGYEPKKKVLGRDGKAKEKSSVISCLAWRDDGWGDQFCVGGTSGVATVFGSL
ncbi:WD repeat domain-containing protein 83 [Colletotrichum trifolii]|uniref:WD repeat domain-containing protein 83 n=1 Tax=Colletotrichum trifolii TaxID=5466 RepID=A0A4R8RU18_COLTR|nr:WD repeat domain-containing protein 83 [Colletotrichum trifolii]